MDGPPESTVVSWEKLRAGEEGANRVLETPALTRLSSLHALGIFLPLGASLDYMAHHLSNILTILSILTPLDSQWHSLRASG